MKSSWFRFINVHRRRIRKSQRDFSPMDGKQNVLNFDIKDNQIWNYLGNSPSLQLWSSRELGILGLVLWAHDKVNPTRIFLGDCLWQWCAGSSCNEKPKVATMVTHLSKPGFTDHRAPQNFFYSTRLQLLSRPGFSLSSQALFWVK